MLGGDGRYHGRAVVGGSEHERDRDGAAHILGQRGDEGRLARELHVRRFVERCGERHVLERGIALGGVLVFGGTAVVVRDAGDRAVDARADSGVLP